MKKTELVKHLGLKIKGQMQKAPIPSRFGGAAAAPLDRREQRKLDQAAGLLPFAVKLHKDLIARLRDEAARQGSDINDITARLIESGLAQSGAPAAAAAPAAQEGVKPAGKAAVELAAAPAGKKAVSKKAAVKAPAKQAADKPASKKAASEVATKAATKKATAKKAAQSRPV